MSYDKAIARVSVPGWLQPLKAIELGTTQVHMACAMRCRVTAICAQIQADAGRNVVAILERDERTVIRLPAPADLLDVVFDLEKRLLGDPARGREELRHIFRDGRITLVPQSDGFGF